MAAKPKAPKRPPVPCEACGKPHQGATAGTYCLPSLLFETVYLCGKACYDDWCERNPPPKPLGPTKPHVPPKRR